MTAGTRANSLLAVIAAVWCFGALSAQQTPTFVVTTIRGATAKGAVTSTATELSIAGDGGTTTVLVGDVVSLVRVGPAASPPSASPMSVWLRSGAVLPATGLEGSPTGGALRWIVHTAAGIALELPQSSIAAVRCRAVEPQTFAADRQEPDANADYLYVVKGGKPQRFRVAIAGLQRGNVNFGLDGKDYDFPMVGDDSVAAIVFGKNTGFAPDRQSKPRVAIRLASGERCEGRLLGIGAAIELAMDEGVTFAVPLSLLDSLEVASDKLTWLGALTPRVEQTAAFDRTWPWTVDASPSGPGIVLRGRTYARGIELVPRTRLTYDLGSKYDLFEATVGIDDRGGPLANAVFRVLADGRLLFESSPLVLGGEPVVLSLELDHCKSLAIEADFGKNFDLGDLCAFADARVVQH